MRIYTMTATFGKLSHETLVLEPGLNIIEAPNEWGKSTWCAFLVAMLYGFETRAKSTKTALADKARFAPWSGEPMAGRIDLNWDGRDITIERRTKGRVPMGEFRAYETESGIEVPELTALNCGQQLLGVERSVFLRSGFIRLSDLPVTNDDSLRRRLNALVTTGDESGAADRLGKGLKDLKNRCRYNRTGLLPQAEEEQKLLAGKLSEIANLEVQTENLKKRRNETENWLSQLENHKAVLDYEASLADELRVQQAQQDADTAAERLKILEDHCQTLPQRDQIQWMLGKINQLSQEVQALQMEEQLVRIDTAPLEVPRFATGLHPEEVVEKAKKDEKTYENLQKRKAWVAVLCATVFLSGGLLALWYLLPGLVLAGLGIAGLAAWLVADSRRKKQRQALESHYGSADPAVWRSEAEHYAAAVRAGKETAQQQEQLKAGILERSQQLEEKIQKMTQGAGLSQCREQWEAALASWEDQVDASRDLQRAQKHAQTLREMAKSAPKPESPDDLTYSEEDTARLISDARLELRQLESRLSQYAGRMEALGDQGQLRRELAQIDSRIAKLEQTYQALSLAQELLSQATTALQRRFAPRIAQRAQELMAQLTDGRYDRLQLAEDLSLLAGAESEDTLRETLWRSDGTVDQLYLALRLAVAEELTPDAPMVLDDALVRFDEKRLKAALKLLQGEGAHKQVILFTCQSREKRAMQHLL